MRWPRRHLMHSTPHPTIGIDLVELDDFRCRLDDRLLNRLLSLKERSRYETITHPQRKLEYVAGRFAAKEAYTKAYRQFERPLNFTEVEILEDAHGAPIITSTYRPQDSLHVSISHTKHYVIAIVSLQKAL
ncbi:MAG: holo-[acyl-carrier-protein] synthase [Acholeplasmatales bacterium]|nr:MAG: holo-[acyl-carrier-protein] synthase [Acholeplasmatales bacterium]